MSLDRDLREEVLEDHSLSVVGALARDLEVEPLLGEDLVLELVEAELVVYVVATEEVLDDGTGLPDGEVIVGMVDEGGHATVGVEVGVRRTLVLAWKK